MKLKELLDGFVSSQRLELSSLSNSTVTGLALNSSKLNSGNVFIALAGSQQHGLVFVNQAIERGAIAVIFDPSDGGIQMACIQ